MKKTRAQKILEKHNCNSYPRTTDSRLAVLEVLMRHLVDNDIAHIWLVLKIILTAIISAAGTILVKVLFKV